MKQEAVQKEVRVEVNAADDSDILKATITVTTTKDGAVVEETVKAIEGTKEEIEAAIEAEKDIKMEIHTEDDH